MTCSVTTGGTGVSARDVTPEATKSLLEKEIPGVSELIRSEFYKDIKTSVLYRGLCGIANNKLILIFQAALKEFKMD